MISHIFSLLVPKTTFSKLKRKVISNRPTSYPKVLITYSLIEDCVYGKKGKLYTELEYSKIPKDDHRYFKANYPDAKSALKFLI